MIQDPTDATNPTETIGETIENKQTVTSSADPVTDPVTDSDETSSFSADSFPGTLTLNGGTLTGNIDFANNIGVFNGDNSAVVISGAIGGTKAFSSVPISAGELIASGDPQETSNQEVTDLLVGENNLQSDTSIQLPEDSAEYSSNSGSVIFSTNALDQSITSLKALTIGNIGSVNVACGGWLQVRNLNSLPADNIQVITGTFGVFAKVDTEAVINGQVITFKAGTGLDLSAPTPVDVTNSAVDPVEVSIDTPVDSEVVDPVAVSMDTPVDGEVDPVEVSTDTPAVSEVDPVEVSMDTPVDSEVVDPVAVSMDTPVDGEVDPVEVSMDTPVDSEVVDPVAVSTDTTVDSEVVDTVEVSMDTPVVSAEEAIINLGGDVLEV